MRAFKFLLFLFTSHHLALQIFRFSTYHAYFSKCVIVLLGFGFACAWMLIYLQLSSYFLFQFFGAMIWLIYTGRSEARMAARVVLGWKGDTDELKHLVLSLSRTRWYFTASAISYLASFALSFLYLYNSR